MHVALKCPTFQVETPPIVRDNCPLEMLDVSKPHAQFLSRKLSNKIMGFLAPIVSSID
jgi:hypothetical protein